MRTTTLCDAAEAEMRFTVIAFARRPKSCGPDARRWRQGTERLLKPTGRRKQPVQTKGSSEQLSPDGDEREFAAGESTKQAEKTIACGTPDVTVLSW